MKKLFTTLVLLAIIGLSACLPVSTANAQTAFITNQNSNTVSVINLATNTVSATITVGGSPTGVSVRPDGSKVYVTNQSTSTVSIINAATNSVSATIPVGSYPIGISVSPDGTKVYVANYGANTVSVINTATNTVSATISVGSYPIGISVSPDGSKVYVANRGANTVSVINTATNTVTATITVGTNPYGVSVSPDGTMVYIANYNSNTVSVINSATNTVLATITVGTHPIGISVSPDGTNIYVTNRNSNTVSVINTVTNTVSATIAVGTNPWGVSVSPNGTMVYIANWGTNTVSVINAATNSVSDTITVGTNPAASGNFITSKSLAAITTTTLSSITQTTATGGGNVTNDGGDSVTARGVCWSTSQNPTTSNSHTTDGTGTGPFTSSITGLTANTTYYVRAYATTSFGTAYGPQVSYNNILLNTVSTTNISNISQTTATGGGNVTNDGGASVTARGVCWSASQNPTTSNSHTTDGTGTGPFTSSITGLTLNTIYYVRAYATNSFGTAYGNQRSFVTNERTTYVNWEIFKNKLFYNFNTLKNTDTIPDQIIKLDSLNTPNQSTVADHFCSRIRGYLIPPVSGNYSFYFATDDVGQFWLSSDTSSANAQLKSQINSIQTDWNYNTSNQSLVAGNKYFFEILHYDTIYTDLVKLGWLIPGNTVPVVIKTPYITACGDSVTVYGLTFNDKEMTAYPNWTLTPLYQLKPWNASNKNMIWESSNNSIATINPNGLISAISPGVCQIIGKAAGDTTVTDTLTLTVTNYYGPYFVKQNAKGKGQSWNDAIDLSSLLTILNEGTLQQKVNIYVTEGIYKPTNTIDRNKSFVLNSAKTIRMLGGYDSTSTGTDTTNRDVINNETILSGNIGVQENSTDNSYHVITIYNPTVIDGFTIRDGRASVSTNGWTPGIYFFKPDDNGGGIYTQNNSASNVLAISITNCKITNNSAWNGGGGICIKRPSGNKTIQFFMENCTISNNIIQQQCITTGGGTINIYINGYAGAIYAYGSELYLNNCLIFNNSAACGSSIAKVIYLEGSSATIERSSIFNNVGNSPDIAGGSIILNVSTLKGQILCTGGTANITNSTIVGGLFSSSQPNITATIDNSIWTGVNLSNFPDTSATNYNIHITAKYSILSNNLYGISKYDVISDSVPNYSSWLDTLNYNGGSTPTMKLKNISGNLAKSYGNPLYLDSTDQRGAVRTDSVSIGAYQWVKATGVAISPKPITICKGDSIDILVSVLPPFVSDDSYTLLSNNNSIATVVNSKIHAISAGNTDIIVQTEDGGFKDTCKVNVIAPPASAGTISGTITVCQGQNSVTYTVPAITDAISYIWTLPVGATGTSDTNSIIVNYGTSAVSGNITVKGNNTCGDGVISNLAITVNPVYVFTENYSICNGETYNWHGTNYTTANTYTANYTSISGCDSIYTLHLTVNPVYTFTENHSICNGETYNWHGTNYTTTGTFNANYTSISSCDSIYILHLTANPVYAFTENHSICTGETYNWHGSDYSIAGSYYDSLLSINGCDSTYILNLSVIAIDTSLTVSYPVISANASGASYQWLDCNNAFANIIGETSQSYTATSNGNYAVRITQGLCTDTSACVQITTVGIATIQTNGISFYPNPVTDNLQIQTALQIKNIEITDITGRLLYTTTSKTLPCRQAGINCRGFAKGAYFIRAITEKGIMVKKFMKE